MLCTLLCGCQTLHYGVGGTGGIYCDEGMLSEQPRELDKVTVPTYRIEPPDVLTIDVVQNVVQSSYVLQVGDVVAISVSGAFPDEPIADEFLIEAGGLVVLGFGYGSVEIVGRTVQEAIDVIEQHLRRQLREPQVSVALRSVAQLQRISGEHLVAADGTISLGQYGLLPVVGLTLDEARYAIASHLSQYFVNPQVSVSVYAFNSKVYYIVTQGGGMGDGLVRLPFTGNETVMDALSQINGLSYVSSSRMWIARPQRDGTGSQILPIDWEGITQRAEVSSNYQVLPGDRIFIAHNSWVAFDGALAKLTSPFERVFGFTLLGTGTASRLSGKVLANQNVVVFSPD